jgi:hypothetical protein
MAVSGVSADVVHLLSGKIVQGEIVTRDEESIKINTGLVIPVTYYLDEIDTINGVSVAPVIVEKKDEPVAVPEEDKSVTVKEPDTVVPEPEQAKTADIAPSTKDIATLDEIDLFKQQPSPAAIKPTEASSTPAQRRKKTYEEYMMGVVEQEIDAPETGLKKAVRRTASQDLFAVLNVIRPYFIKQIEGYRATQEYFRQQLPSIKERLESVPVRVRKDALIFISAFTAIFYLFLCYPFMQIARKLGKKHPWLVWIPIVQVFYFTYMAGKSMWWMVLYLVPVVNVLFPLLLCADLLRALRKPFWLIVFIIFPGTNIVMFWYLAVSKTTMPAEIAVESDIEYK